MAVLQSISAEERVTGAGAAAAAAGFAVAVVEVLGERRRRDLGEEKREEAEAVAAEQGTTTTATGRRAAMRAQAARLPNGKLAMRCPFLFSNWVAAASIIKNGSGRLPR